MEHAWRRGHEERVSVLTYEFGDRDVPNKSIYKHLHHGDLI